MKAAVYYQNGGPEVFRYEEVPTPVAQAGEVLVRIKSISIEGGDLIHRESRPLVHVPHIVGYQCAGDVVAVGPGVTDRTVGQRVLALTRWGSHAEYVAVEASRTFGLPDELAYDTASAIPTAFFTAQECLFTFGHLRAGQSVLIHGGSGALGLATIQLAKRAGATVITTGSDDAKLARLKAFGSDHEINYRTGNVVQEVLNLTQQRGADLIVDSVGGGQNLTQSAAAVAYRGTITFVGVTGRDKTLFDPLVLWRKNASLAGVYMPVIMDQEPERLRADISRLIAQVAAGELRVLLDRSFPLPEAAVAHQYILDKKAFGRVLLIP